MLHSTGNALLPLVLLLSACSEKAPPAPAATTSAPVATSAPQQEDTARPGEPTGVASAPSDEGDALASCPETTTVEYLRTDGAADKPKSFGEVKKVFAKQVGEGTLDVMIANHEDADFTLKTVLASGQLLLELWLHAGTGNEVRSGRYPHKQAGDPDTKAYAYSPVLLLPGELSTGWDAPTRAEVEVIARTKDKVCGRYTFEDSAHRVKVEFVADIVLDEH
jgi:hypothetical protein